ncbi:RICIN domain-containing protein [Nocardia goodfellowii]|uniref:Uncharacterized protein n=1 Tax=Nocardia goodfellowii TaxID=882446 RepID=A0ABS4QET4_9NOCA|nr:hypothetical protein [Nocardia goodfellowii]MBP2190200.1 hypothetical protein [Nocardia goodfellowii]
MGNVFERWEIFPFEEGVTIQNKGTKFWAMHPKDDDDVRCCYEFDSRLSKWCIEEAGDGRYIIQLADRDLVWTAFRQEPDGPLSVGVRPDSAEGHPTVDIRACHRRLNLVRRPKRVRR